MLNCLRRSSESESKKVNGDDKHKKCPRLSCKGEESTTLVVGLG